MTAKTFDWSHFVREVSNKVPQEKYVAWIEPLRFVEINESSLVITAPSDFAKDWVPQLFGATFREVLFNEYGLRLDVKIEKAATEAASSDSSAMLAVAEAPIVEPANSNSSMVDDFLGVERENIVASRSVSLGGGYSAISVRDLSTPAIRTVAQPINPKFTFSNYIVGASNQFAHAAAHAVAESPSRQYNPLFLHSNSGLGKTHLLHAIGNHVLKVNPRARVCYVSAERFVNDLVEAIHHKKTAEFRQKYRQGYDVLLMDDIQFIANKKGSEEEFFHTFNALHNSDKQIVVASDKHPKDIPGLEDRIRTRFEWGLVVDVQIPDIETRLAILRAKAEQDDIYLPNDVGMFLATNVKNNVRELEGQLLRLGAKASLLGVEISLDLAKNELSHLITEPFEEGSLDPTQILDSVARHFGIKVSDLKSKDRSRRVAEPRQIAMYLVRKHCKRSYPDIGALLGGKDHSTIVYGVRMITDSIDSDHELRGHVEKIQAHLA